MSLIAVLRILGLLLAIAVFVLRYASHKLPPFLSHVETEEEAGGLRDPG